MTRGAGWRSGARVSLWDPPPSGPSDFRMCIELLAEVGPVEHLHTKDSTSGLCQCGSGPTVLCYVNYH